MAGKDNDTHPVLVALAQRLRSMRNAKHLTLMEVLDATNVNVARVESNSQNMTVKTLIALCEYYGVTLGELFTDIEKEAQKKD